MGGAMKGTEQVISRGGAVVHTDHLRPVRTALIGLACLVTGAAGPSTAREGPGFKAIFDGKTLAGWKAPDMSFWSVVRDEAGHGAITARSTAEHPVPANQFLVWQLGELDDFELKLQYRIAGTPQANSGIQFRGRVGGDGHVAGYQADIDLGGSWTGALYDERGRGLLAARGEKTVIKAGGGRTRTSIGSAEALWASVRRDGWNEYHITARGSRLVLRINGRVTAEVVDEQERENDLSGVLALQLHAGPPMTVQFRGIRLRRLKMPARKKIVLVAGRASHGHSAHEHNAGCLLLARLLNETVPQVHAAVYRDGWPADPTAFDNADAVAIFCDGGGGHVVMRHLAEMDGLVKKGVGLACLHYGVEVPKGRPGGHLLDWIGGYFETHWSVNPHWEADFTRLPRHPITRGVRPFRIDDEWYYHMRFRKGMKGVTPILTAVPPDKTRQRPDGPHSNNPTVRARKGMPEHVAWASERPGAGIPAASLPGPRRSRSSRSTRTRRRAGTGGRRRSGR
jgi:hypothetical protein